MNFGTCTAHGVLDFMLDQYGSSSLSRRPFLPPVFDHLQYT